MAPDESYRLFSENVGQIAAVCMRDRAVAIQIPLEVRLPSAGKSRELVEAATVRMVARIVSAVMPFADDDGLVARSFQQFSHGQLAHRKTIEAARFERVDYSGAMRIAACHYRCSRGRANRRRRVV